MAIPLPPWAGQQQQSWSDWDWVGDWVNYLRSRLPLRAGGVRPFSPYVPPMPFARPEPTPALPDVWQRGFIQDKYYGPWRPQGWQRGLNPMNPAYWTNEPDRGFSDYPMYGEPMRGQSS